MRGLSGHLLSLEALASLAAERPGAPGPLRRALEQGAAALGPASTTRHVVDRLVAPLLATVGLDWQIVDHSRDASWLVLSVISRPVAGLVVGAWGQELNGLWQPAVRLAARRGARWAMLTNGAALRLVDAERTYSRRALDCDLRLVVEDDAAVTALAALLAPQCLAERLGSLIAASDRHRIAVGASLQNGVESALVHLVSGLVGSRRGAATADRAFADALTIIYRILFLLFAEARGLVPQWHPLYRDGYTIEALRPRIEREPRPAGLWESLQAISRLAHRGCLAGTLRVTPFNGRLFAPATAPLAETIAIDDRLVRDALLSLTTRQVCEQRTRISYADLGVEQLGAVYESVLDYAPRATPGSRLVSLAPTGRRKATGSFYTPRPIAEYLVRRTLAPLLRGRTADEILSLRILDPAMGSGAFLVAACAQLSTAYEQALVRDGSAAMRDLGPADRAAFRRVVAQRCLYGVDLNPTAVQLARLSLWLSTLAADRPLTFFDHRLRAGNSLVGASPADIARQPPTARGRSSAIAFLPLFDDLTSRLAASIAPRTAIELEPDDTAAIVRRKERDLAAVHAPDGPLGRWRALADAWCAAWFWDGAPRGGEWQALADAAFGRASGLPGAVETRWLAAVREIAACERFFHWELEFPEVFFARDGQRLDAPGFDAVLGNPPWEMLRDDHASVQDGSTATARRLTTFTRRSGTFRLQGDGHANLYQLFVERMLQLVKPGGRIGALAPSGLTMDTGSARLRQALFERCGVDALLSLENRDGIFPIHRGLRFVLITATSGEPRADIPCRLGMRSASALDAVPDEGPLPESVILPLSLVRRIGGPELAIPELRSPRDREIVSQLASAPPLGDRSGWRVTFGRDLNATDDRHRFGEDGVPVLEGKMIDPFVARVDEARWRLSRREAERRLGDRWRRARLSYREVAAATNRLTLIAAVLPPDVVATHTVFCAHQHLDDDDQHFLCGVLNSFVANYLVRLRVGTHVTAGIMERLPVPRPAREDASRQTIAALARRLAREPSDRSAAAALQGRVADLYGLDAAAFEHVLGTFPLIAADEKQAALSALTTLRNGI